ncbi:hypothetical protein V8E53_012624 [Lactarius tabidus]
MSAQPTTPRVTASYKCMTGETACINGQLAQCVGDKFVINRQGKTSVTCDMPQDKREIEMSPVP